MVNAAYMAFGLDIRYMDMTRYVVPTFTRIARVLQVSVFCSFPS